MSFDLLKVSTDIKPEEDSLPPEGGSFGPLNTNVYPMIIKLAYFSESSGGATALNLHFKNADGSGPVVRQTIYVTSGKKKGKKNYYTTPQGEKRLLPGMALADQLHQLVAESHLADAEVEDKIVKLWNYEEQAEVNTEVKAIMSLINKPIMVGLVKKKENKRVQNDDDEWVDGPDAREFNEVEKFFDTDGRTLTEKNADGEPEFIKAWKKRFPEDHVQDKFKAIEGSSKPASNDGATEKEIKSLF